MIDHTYQAKLCEERIESPLYFLIITRLWVFFKDPLATRFYLKSRRKIHKRINLVLHKMPPIPSPVGVSSEREKEEKKEKIISIHTFPRSPAGRVLPRASKRYFCCRQKGNSNTLLLLEGNPHALRPVSGIIAAAESGAAIDGLDLGGRRVLFYQGAAPRRPRGGSRLGTLLFSLPR